MPIFSANSFRTAGLLSRGSHFFPMLVDRWTDCVWMKI